MSVYVFLSEGVEQVLEVTSESRQEKISVIKNVQTQMIHSSAHYSVVCDGIKHVLPTDLRQQTTSSDPFLSRTNKLKTQTEPVC